jgi:hypothetical protein
MVRNSAVAAGISVMELPDIVKISPSHLTVFTIFILSKTMTDPQVTKYTEALESPARLALEASERPICTHCSDFDFQSSSSDNWSIVSSPDGQPYLPGAGLTRVDQAAQESLIIGGQGALNIASAIHSWLR